MGTFIIQTFKLIEVLMELQTKKIADPTVENLDYCTAPSLNNYYIDFGVRYHPTFTLNYDINTTGYKAIYNTDPAVASVFENFMNNSPYRSIWIDSDCDGNKDSLSSGSQATLNKTINVNSNKTVYVGLIGDNKFILNHNGVDVVRVTNIDVNNFRYLHIFPLTLITGENTLTFTGIGDGSVNDALGVIVLDNSIDDIMGLTNGELDETKDPIPKSQWNVLYSSEDSLGSTVDIVTCPSGYSYNNDTGNCVAITDISEINVNDYGLISPTNIENKTIDKWIIDYGDGTIDNGTNSLPSTFEHQYTTTGTFLIKFKIKYSDGTYFQGRKEFTVTS